MRPLCRLPYQLLLLLLLFPSTGFSQPGNRLPQGRIIGKVPCGLDASQTYALYLPSNYAADKQWPILYALDAGARGTLPVERFQEAAEKYGYILAGSNNSRNGPVKIVQDAMNALLVDTRTRFSVDPRRMYVAGFSGGARAAAQVGLAMNGKIAGIIAFGAGFPPDMPPAAPIPFAIYLAAGNEDFNFAELRELDGALERFQTPHEFETFSGGHEWPSAAVCTHAIEWLELQGMKSGIRARDPILIEEIYAKALGEAALHEKDHRLRESLERYSSALRSFSGLRDVERLQSSIQRLNQTVEIRRSRSVEKEAETRQKTTDRELIGLFQDLIHARDRQFTLQKLNAELDRLRNDAGQEKDEIRHLAATRSLTRFWIMLNEEGSDALERHEFSSAVLRLELMARIRPDNPNIYYHLAIAHCMSGRKKEAMESLRKAVAKGFKDIAILESNSDLDPLRKMPEYQKIIEDLKPH
jgi:pimeloyl-ACP methyl ester carboxylesterase